MSSRKLPDLDEPCGRYFTFRDLIECGDTFREVRPDNQPRQEATYAALIMLAELILDPVIDEFGAVELTYGLATNRLTKHIKSRIAPRLDQHASHERNSRGNRICARDGAAVDFLAPGMRSDTLAQWVVLNTPFDRLYFYGTDRPIHVSVAPEPCQQCTIMLQGKGNKIVPRSSSVDRFLSVLAEDAPGAK